MDKERVCEGVQRAMRFYGASGHQDVREALAEALEAFHQMNSAPATSPVPPAVNMETVAALDYFHKAPGTVSYYVMDAKRMKPLAGSAAVQRLAQQLASVYATEMAAFTTAITGGMTHVYIPELLAALAAALHIGGGTGARVDWRYVAEQLMAP